MEIKKLIVPIILFGFYTGLTESGIWYQGCFKKNFTQIQKNQIFQGKLPNCSRTCLKERFEFIGIQGSDCQCFETIEYLYPVSTDLCQTSCHEVAEPNLQCGSHNSNTWSVYTAAGPYIESVEPYKVTQWVETNIPKTLQATVRLNTFFNIKEETEFQSEWGNTLEFVWQTEFAVDGVVGVNISANSSLEQAVCTLTFPNSGNFPIELRVRNLVSIMLVKFNVAVVDPKPRQLQLSLLNVSSTLPSCIPPLHNPEHHHYRKTYTPPNDARRRSDLHPVIAVFANSTFVLEAAVATGRNLVFDISIWNGNLKEVFQHVPHKGEDKCSTPMECKSVTQDYVFKRTGVFNASATVSNEYGSAEQELTIVVMDQGIRDVFLKVVPGVNVFSTHSRLDFHLTAVTADRQSTFITIDFGDGIVTNSSVRENHDNGSTFPELSSPTLFASYGEGCDLSLEFYHVYTAEGVFDPLVTLNNQVTSVSVKLQRPLTLLHAISGTRVESDLIGPVLVPIPFNIVYSSISGNVSVLWSVFHDNGHEYVQRNTDCQYNDVALSKAEDRPCLRTSFVFPEVGRYEVFVTVSNGLGSENSSSHIFIQEPIGQVRLSCSQGPYVEVEQEVVCKADANSGTDVLFNWDFHDASYSTEAASLNTSSIAKHSFLYPGTYDISVAAYNNLSSVLGVLSYSLHVETPIDCLNVSLAATQPRVPFSLVVNATRGSHVGLELDVGRGEKVLPRQVTVDGHTTSAVFILSYSRAGIFPVTVVASNHISNVSQTFEVDVQETPPEFCIQILPASLPEFITLTVKSPSGKLVHREDLIFKFQFHDEESPRITQVPVVTREVNKRSPTPWLHLSQWGDCTSARKNNTAGDDDQDSRRYLEKGASGKANRFFVEVTVSNLVGQRSRGLTLSGFENNVRKKDGRWRGRGQRKSRKNRKNPTLWHDTVVKVRENTAFLLANKSNGVNSLLVNYDEKLTEIVPCLKNSCSWGHEFQVPGVFALDVSFYGRKPNSNNPALRSVLVVEEPIKDLRLLGPTDVGIGCSELWQTQLESGSHVIYVWLLDGVTQAQTTSNKFTIGFNSPGAHTLLVNATNEISSAQASMSFTVKHPIVGAVLDIPASILGVPTNLSISIQGGQKFNITLLCGENHPILYPFESLSVTQLNTENLQSSREQNFVPKYLVKLQHTFQEIGDYNVSVLITNGISSVRRSRRAVVEETIGRVRLYTDSTYISINDELVVTAVVSSGKNLNFAWDFSDSNPTTVISEGNTSKASHLFSVASKYEVSVIVSNHLQKKGIQVKLPFQIEVIEPLSTPQIIHIVDPSHNLSNTAALETNDALATPAVGFAARCGGSSVIFTFDFGDGTFITVEGMNDLSSMKRAYVEHVYTKEGVYDVKVAATNPLGSATAHLSGPFYVQVPPKNLKVDANSTCIQFGEVVYLNASVEAGTNVSYNWKVDDGREIINEGNYVTHKYRQTGERIIQVIAHNKVGFTEHKVLVKIVEKILGVNVSVSSYLVVQDHPVKHVAKVHPPSVHASTDKYFKWHFSSDPATSKYETNGNYIYSYKMIGWQRVKVTAGNCKGEVESEPVKMLVVAPIRGLSINILKDTLLGSTVLFSAVSLQGNLANYTWDFGDGHFLNHSNNDTAAHDYQQVGEYMVRLYATNPVGSSEAAKRIFVLPEYCKPPQITILGYQPQTDYIQLEFLQSELIRVEANIKINCSVTSRVRFRWEVKAASNHVPVNLYLPRMVERRAYRHVKSPALILPPWTLDEGKYIFQLKVEMNGTIIPVYSESEVNVTIKSTPLVSHIHGGIYRHIKQNSTVILDGRKSVNADDSSVKLGFLWGCHPLKAKSESCFYNSSLIPERNTSVLMFPASWLNSNYTQFVFNLTVFKPTPLAAAANKTEEIAVADQVIKVLPDPNVLEVLLECPQCYKNRVNSDRKISFRTHCVSCPEGPLHYKWEIFRISNSLVQDSQSLCTFLSDDSALHSLNHGDDSEDKTSINALSRDQLATSIGRVPKVENTPIMIIDKPDAQTGELRNEDDQDKQMPSVFEGFLSISEGQMGESRRPKASNNRVRVEFPSVDEGINPPRARPAQQPTSTAAPEGCVAPDCHIREIPLSTETPHIVSIKKDAIYLRPESTLTGLDQPSLVLKPGTLRPGISYIIEVMVTSKDGSSGLAMILVEVNRSPMKGRCSLRSQKAALSVFCTDWKDEHLPLLYEVSYSLNGSGQDGQLGIVYQGPRHNIVVKPPVGLTPSTYPVQLHVAVLNRLGARTLICSTSILTEGPRHNTTGDKTLETFLNESVTLHRLAASSVYEDSSYDLLESLTQLALQLNAHATLEDTQASPLQAGEDIRSNIIESLSYIPLRHEVEIINALKCLIEATHLPHQLNAKSVLIASILLKDINVETEVLMAVNNVSGYTRGLHPEILNLGMKLVSNILTAVSSNHTLFVQNKIHIYKSIITDTLDVLNNFIQLELQYHSIGEKSLFLKDKFLSLNASHYTLGEPTPLEMNGVVFRLPSSLGVFLSKSSAEDTVAANISGAVVSRSLAGSDYLHNGLCFQARTMSFSINPFAVLSNKTDMIQSELATLDIYNCFGDGLVHVQELPADDMIHIIIPRKPSIITNTSTQHYLDKAIMNIHQVNASLPKYYYDISGEDGLGVPANYLHVHIQLEPVAEGRSFPIMVIMSSLSPPHNLKNYVFKKQYEPDTQEIKIFLSHGPYDGSQHYYISLVEASFNSGRRRSNEVKGRLYTLSTWLGTCVYWKHASNKWSSSGCQVLPSSSVEALHCRCNHLTTFGGYFELIPNDLSFISVEEFFSPHENPVVIILLGVLLAVYLSLAVVLRPADVHDAKKGTCVFLRDNSLSHQQKYEVIMETGFSHGAGTTSKISIILHGEEGMSETRELISEDNRPMFERNSRDRFIVTLPSSLGRIYKIQLWHNNTGSSPGWYLRQVVVRDLSAGQAYYFLCQRWLAVDRDDGNVEREFTVIDGSNISFSMIFWWKSSQYLSDFHTWISLWTCPPHSRFTRVQRLSVCLTLLLSYMCLSAIWFSQVPPKIRGEFGLLDLSWQNILVGCGCCAIIIPLNIFLSFLFRRSRVHYPGHQQDKAIVAGKSVSDFVSDGEDESAPQSAVTYSILDQSILNWQNIQEWAQKQWLKRQQSVRSSANSVKTTQTSPQLSGPLAAPLVQQTLLAEDDTDQASSGFEDATSQATAERHRVKATSDISSDGKKSRNVEHCDVGVLATSWRFFLPFWCRYIAWTLCFCLSCACAAITVMYGFRFGYTKSVMWLQSVYFSLMMCIFIAQPLLIFLVVLYTALCQRNNASVFDHYEDGFYGERVICRDYIQPYSHLTEEEEELQRGVAERSRSRYLRFAGPPQEKQLRSSRKKLIKQRRAMLLLMDFCFFVFMFILLSIMAFGKNTTAHYQLNKSLKDAFLVKQSENSPSFLKVRSASGWYRWSQTVLIDTLYSHTSWSNQSLHPGETLGLVIGNVQLRQLTFAPKTCQSFHYLAPNFDCFHTTDNSSDTNSSDSFRQQHQATDNHFSSRGFWGQNYWLDTSGYTLQLNHSRDEAIKQLIGLETEGWINKQTKAVIIEMTLYNAATNLFSSLTLLYEVEASGHVSTASYIMSTYLFRYITIWDNCILGCELFCIVITLLMCYNQLQHVIMLGKSYFYHFWNYIELLMCTSFLLYTGCYIYRCILVSEAVEFIRSTFYEQFIPLGFVALWDQILQGLVSVMLFCVMLKLLQVLRYHQIFWRLQSVYRRCKQELLLAGSLYIGFILAFSSLSTGLFGAVQYSMRSLWSSVMAMTALSVRRFHWSDNQVLSQEQNPWLDIVLMFSFTFCHGFIMTYIFSVLAYRFKKTKNCHVLAMPASQLLSFYWDKMVKWSGSRPEACHEEIDNSLPPEFTMAEILYLVEELLFRMNALLGTSGLPDKRNSLTDSDSTQNYGDDGISSGGSDVSLPKDQMIPITMSVALEGARLEHRVQKIEDKLCSNEPYLAQLLKLDSIGTDILSEEKEKEIRSHLEFEIFRQLQMQRQEAAVCEQQELPVFDASSKSAAGQAKYSSPDSTGPEPIRQHLPHCSPFMVLDDSTEMQKKGQVHKENSSTCSDLDPDEAEETGGAAQLKPLMTLPPKRSQSLKVPGRQAGRYDWSPALTCQKQWLDLSTGDVARDAKLTARYLRVASTGGVASTGSVTSASAMTCAGFVHKQEGLEHPPDKKDIQSSSQDKRAKAEHKQDKLASKHKPEAPHQNLTAGGPKTSSGNVSPQSSEGERGHKRTDSSSGQSERMDTPRLVSKKPELPPKPTFAHSMLRPMEAGKALSGWSCKPKQFNPELMSPMCAESSSGSEQEASSKRLSQGRRNLRKTKSRGKGKGNEACMSSPMVLEADFTSSGQSSNCNILIHPVPSGINLDDSTMPEQFLN